MRLLLLFCGCLLSTHLSAQEVLAALPANEELQLSQLSEIIRWSGVFTSLIVIFIAYSLIRFIHRLVERVSEQFAQRRLFLQKIETVSQFAIYIITALLVFNLSLRIDDRVLALIGGTLAVSVGFALKDLVASFIAGLMIMIDRPFQVGDRLEFGGQYGDVLSIGLRSVRINTLDDDIVTIPNNKFLNDITKSGNFGELDMHVGMDFYIGYDQDVTLAKEIIAEAAASSRYIHLPRPITVLVSQHVMDNYIAIKLRLKAYVLDTHYEKLFETDVNLRVISEFNRQQIQPAAVLHRDLVPAKTEQPSEE
ncbi:MAG: mechanosensitive ion channel [Pseudomonadales bacterium]|nr:mechanosensitive ion channel [Pseudomonadales bacterium]